MGYLVGPGAVFALAFSGCSYHVTVISRPPGALLVTPSGERMTTPADIPLRWAKHAGPLKVSAPGYRTLKLHIGPGTEGWDHFVGPWLAIRKKAQVEIVLVPLHGPVGTWNPDDVD